MYPELMLIPMREELTKAGVEELRNAAEVDRAISVPGTTMIIVNSVCGCAAAKLEVLRLRSADASLRSGGQDL